MSIELIMWILSFIFVLFMIHILFSIIFKDVDKNNINVVVFFVSIVFMCGGISRFVYLCEKDTVIKYDKILKANCWIDDDGEYHYVIQTEKFFIKRNDVENIVLSSRNVVEHEEFKSGASGTYIRTIHLHPDSVNLIIGN